MSELAVATTVGLKANLRDYVAIARLDHVTKHVFILPGLALAVLLRPESAALDLWSVILGFSSAVLIASANYVINEWLDRSFDRHHPEKSKRAAVHKEMSATLVYTEYLGLLAAGLLLAALLSPTFLGAASLFALSGVLYNVRPFRTKDIVFLDVLTESFNNPLRLTIGWTMVDPQSLPPSSLLLGFWFGGAFLMNSKRLAEYRDLCAAGLKRQLELYRRSFRSYTEEKLLVANLAYSVMCSFFTGVFLIKYRIEYIALFPFMAALFAQYFLLALRPNSVARKPERLFREPRLVAVACANALVFGLCTFFEVSELQFLTEQHYILLPVSAR